MAAWAFSVPCLQGVRNKPLGLLMAWWGVRTLFLWTAVVRSGQGYPVGMLPGVLHALLLVLAYFSLCQLLTPLSYALIGKWLAVSTLGLLGYGLLQLVSLDQFFTQLSPAFEGDLLVGTIGNPTHFAAQLALLSPWLWLQSGWFWKGVSVLAFLLLLLCGSTAGMLAYAAAFLVWGWHRFSSRRVLFSGVVLAGLGLFGVLSFQALNPHGRWEAWGQFYSYFQHRPITGLGLGYVMELSKIFVPGHPLYGWRHVHNEYFQLAIEGGVIALALVSWLIYQTGQRFARAVKTPTVVACAASLVALLVNSLLNFPLHLAGIGAYGLFAYVGLCLATPEV